MKPLRLAILASLLLHATLVAILWWGASFLTVAKPGGSGGSSAVSIWIAGPDGQTIGGDAIAPKQAAPKGSGAMTAEALPKPSATRPPEAASGETAAAPGSGAGGNTGIGVGSGSGIGSGSGGDPVLARIWKKINSSKYYPENAKRKGIEGSPRVTFSIGEDGHVAQVDLAASCGDATLDEAARETIRRAAPLPPYPGPITLTVRYSLAN